MTNVVPKATQKINSLALSMAREISQGNMQPAECPVVHRFADNCYLREILMPKGTLIVGKIHKTQHFNVILTGSCSVYTRDGVEHYTAPATFISDAGVQKVVLCHEDVRWQTLHVTDKTDLAEIEKDVIEETDTQIEVLEIMQRCLS